MDKLIQARRGRKIRMTSSTLIPAVITTLSMPTTGKGGSRGTANRNLERQDVRRQYLLRLQPFQAVQTPRNAKFRRLVLIMPKIHRWLRPRFQSGTKTLSIRTMSRRSTLSQIHRRSLAWQMRSLVPDRQLPKPHQLGQKELRDLLLQAKHSKEVSLCTHVAACTY